VSTNDSTPDTTATASSPGAAWPTAAPGSPGVKIGFPGAHEVPTPSRHMNLRALILLVSGGVGVIVLIIIALLATPGPAPYCKPLKCQGPPIGHPKGVTLQGVTGRAEESGTFYKAPTGFSLRFVAATKATATQNGLDLTYAFNTVGTAFLDVFGFPAQGSTEETLVEKLVQANFPNAQPVYEIPDPLIGYHPAFGEAFNITSTSSDGTTETYRALVASCVYNGFAVDAVALGPLLPIVNDKSQFFNAHPSPANTYIAYFYGTDSLLDSVQFPSFNN
jgi:hypothetical protein